MTDPWWSSSAASGWRHGANIISSVPWLPLRAMRGNCSGMMLQEFADRYCARFGRVGMGAGAVRERRVRVVACASSRARARVTLV